MKLAALVLALAAVAAAKLPPTPGSFARTPNSKPMAKALAVRGGGALGPVTPAVATSISLIGGAGYTVEMMVTTRAALVKYWGKASPTDTEVSLTSWFGFAIFGQNLIVATLFALGVDPALLCQAQTLGWALALLKYTLDFNAGILKDKTPIFVQAIFAAVLGYCGFA